MAAPLLRRQNAGWYRFNVGALECTSIWDGYIHHSYEGIYPNADPAEMARLKTRFRLAFDHIPMDLNPAVVNTGDKLFLIDAGMGNTSVMFGDTMGRMLNNMAAAGIDPHEIDAVLMTHLHPDHSYGLIYPDGSPVYPNATLYTTREEWQEWTDEANLLRNDFRKPWTEGTRAAVAPYRDRLSFVTAGQTLLPGLSTMSVAGHSSGQCAYIFESQEEKIAFTGDAAHHQVFDPIHPEWYFHMVYDSDPVQGAVAKQQIFSRAAQEGIRYHGYHFPFPGVGDIEDQGDGTFLFHAEMPTPRL